MELQLCICLCIAIILLFLCYLQAPPTPSTVTLCASAANTQISATPTPFAVTLCAFASDSHVKGCSTFIGVAKEFYDVMMYGEKDIQDFYNSDAVKSIVYRPDGTLGHGFGYWVFKPYVILETLKRVPLGTIVLYSDCNMQRYKEYENVLSTKHVENVKRAVEFQPIYCQHSRFKNEGYCKRDVLILMDCDTPEFRQSYQLQANIIAIKNTTETQSIINEWLQWCIHPDQLVCGEDNLGMRKKFPEKHISRHGKEHGGYITHRHDQAILTCLLHTKRMYMCAGDRLLRADNELYPFRPQQETVCFHFDQNKKKSEKVRGFLSRTMVENKQNEIAVAVIIVWIGKLPEYFKLWKMSALFNKDVDFFIFTDVILDDEFNIHFHYISTDLLVNMIKNKCGIEVDLDVKLRSNWT